MDLGIAKEEGVGAHYKMSSFINTNANMDSCYEYACKVVSNEKDRREYAAALLECRLNPAYYALTKSGEVIPVSSYPLMSWDTKGWNTVKRKIRVKKVRSSEELDEEADINNWDDVEHYGRVTYTQTAPAYEHNGALFDLGSRF
jgi:hypothetical protein